MKPTLVFDIETIPDVAGLRRLHGLPADMSDAEVAELAFQQRRAQNNSDFLPLPAARRHHLLRAALRRCAEGLVALGTRAGDEGEIIQRFFDGVEKVPRPSWSRGTVAASTCRCCTTAVLVHGVTAPRYWDMGDGDYGDSRDFKWNNYISRYHTRHLDLMDLLAMYQPRANAPLDDLAKLIGFPASSAWTAAGLGCLPAGAHQ